MTEFVTERRPVEEAKPSNGTSHATTNNSAADGGDAASAAMNGRDRQSSGSAHDVGADGNTGATANSGMKKRRKVNHGEPLHSHSPVLSLPVLLSLLFPRFLSATIVAIYGGSGGGALRFVFIQSKGGLANRYLTSQHVFTADDR